MKNFLKAISAALSVLLAFSLCGCDEYESASSENNGSSEIKQTEYCLLYDSSDSLMPFTATSTVNHLLFPLVFPGLIENNADYNSEGVLASSWNIDGNTIAFTLSGKCFSDSEPVTANDVVFSYGLAKSSKKYSGRFDYIKSYKAEGNTFYVTFKSHAENNISLLDIPVVKSKDGRYIGAGTYSFSDINGSPILTENGGDGIIVLNPLESSSMTVHSFNKKSASAVSIDMSNNTVTVKGNYEIKEYLTNRFVYIGFNCKKGVFVSSATRKAICLLIDRVELSEKDGFSNATYVWTPFNPLYNSLSSFDLPSSVYLPDESAELLASLGYTKSNGKWNTGGLTLIVNSEDCFKALLADTVASMLVKSGIQITVKKLDFQKFTAALVSGDFDLFLGETLMPVNMDITVLARPALNYGGFDASALTALYNAVADGNTSVNAFSDFLDISPILPVCYRKQSLIYSRELNESSNSSQFSVYNGLFPTAVTEIGI